jgi:hypothetical protein
MANCATCTQRRDDCPDGPDGALIALGPFWEGRDRDCPRELEEWRKTIQGQLGTK